MSLDTSIPGWLDELRYAESSIKPYLETYREDKLRFQGVAYKAGEGRGDPHNHALLWFSLMRSQLLIGNPMVKWTSDLGGDAEARALALTYACNQVSRRLRLRDLNEQLLMDFGFKWAVCLITSAPAPGYEGVNDAKRWPAAYRISPEHFRYDVAAPRVDARAWSGHLVIRSRRELMKEAANGRGHWNREALEKLEKQDVKKWRGSKTPERDEVAYWEIWSRFDGEGDPKKGYNGKIYTIVDNQAEGVGWIRDPFDAFVPPWGPYQCGGDFLVPDESAPMGTITASSQQAAYLNRIKRATMRAIENYKQFSVVRGVKLAEMIKNADDQWVYHSDDADIRSSVMPMTQGGATEQHFVAAEDAMRTLDEVSGITDLMKGNVNPNNKATADALAAQASGMRTSGTVSKFHDLVTRIMYSIGYMIDRDDDIEIELGPQAAGMFVDKNGNPTTRLSGGLDESQDPEEFFAMDLDLRVGSMERDLEMDNQMRMAVIDQTVQAMASFGPQASLFTDIQAYLDAKAEITGVRELRTMFDVETMRQVGALMIQQGQVEAPNPQPSPQPRYSGSGSLPAQQAAKAGPLTATPVGAMGEGA